MTGYWIARATIRDRDALGEYAEIVRSLQAKHPGFETLSRRQRFVELEGDRSFEEHYLHRFPSYEAALALYNSPEYQRASEIRRAACDACELVLLEGGDGLTAQL